MATITIHRGTEGPCHEPYGFEEMTVTRQTPTGQHVITTHEGLADWIEIDGERHDVSHEAVRDMFEMTVGCSYYAAKRAYERAEATCRNCGKIGAIVDSVSGYPGETLYLCECGAVVSCSINWSEVE